MKPFVSLFLLAAWAAQGQQTPKFMTKVSVQVQSPDVPADSFAAKPKVMYRAGSTYCRVEEQPDPAHGIHGLMIIHEPDVWLINLADKTARHVVDPGPTFICRMQILAGRLADLPEDEAKAVAALEFGLEDQFFAAHGAKFQPGPEMQGQKTMMAVLNFGESKLALFTYGSPSRPLAVAWMRGGKNDIYWYSGYGEMPFDASLFALPAGLRVTEAK